MIQEERIIDMKKINRVLILLMFFVAAVFCMGCGNDYKHINHEEAKQIIKSESNIILLDVRTQEEYDKKHIPGALLLPIADIKEGKFGKLPDKNQKILIYCWTGRRAEDSAKILVENGYTNVYEFGGIINWTGEIEGEEVDN